MFSTRDPQKIKEAEEALAIPKFSAPWTSEDAIIPLRLQEELPLGHKVICLPALNQLDNSIVTSVKMNGESSEYFRLDSTNGLFIFCCFLWWRF